MGEKSSFSFPHSLTPKHSKIMKPTLNLRCPSPLPDPTFTDVKRRKLAFIDGAIPIDKYYKDLHYESPLVILGVDLNVKLNGFDHLTYGYSQMNKPDPELVVRRGTPFRLGLRLSRCFSKKRDFFTLFAKHLATRKVVETPVTNTRYAQELNIKWNCLIEFVSMEPAIYLLVTAPSDCKIGKWQLEIESKGLEKKFTLPDPIIVLFNPACPFDDVYLEDKHLRTKYVMDNIGEIFKGTSDSIYQRVWKFNQFDDNILDEILHLMAAEDKFEDDMWESPDYVTKQLTLLVRSQNGLIETNFTDSYNGGIAPEDWTGSGEIMRLLKEQNYIPVKYGQCSTIAALLVTGCRTLGIPARTTTCFNFGMNAEDGCYSDLFFDLDGSYITSLCKDRIWAFHVWAEAWMMRSVLGASYSGWQGLSTCKGPASMEAVKLGELQIPFDVKFFFEGFRTQLCIWKFYSDVERLKLVSRKECRSGSIVMTKELIDKGTNITEMYKPLSDKKIELTDNMVRFNKRFKDYIVNESFNEIIFELIYPKAIYFGKTISIDFKMENKNKEIAYVIKFNISLYSQLYIGRQLELIKRDKRKWILRKGETHVFNLTVSYDEYCSVLLPEHILNCTAYCFIDERDFDFFKEAIIRIKQPELLFRVSAHPKLKEKANMDVTLYNPLAASLSKGQFILEEVDTTNKVVIPYEEIHPKEAVKANFMIYPEKEGSYDIIGKFSSTLFTTWTAARLVIRESEEGIQELITTYAKKPLSAFLTPK